MEFDEDCVLFQGVLSNLQRTRCSLISITSQKCFADDISAVVTRLKSTIESMLKNIPDDQEERKTNLLRKLNLFIALNTNFKCVVLLAEDDNFSHVIGSCPSLSTHLYMEIVSELSLENYFCECIAYCPPVLCVEFLDVIIQKLDSLSQINSLKFIVSLCSVVYIHIISLERNNQWYKLNPIVTNIAKHKLYTYFKILLGHFSTGDAKKMKGKSVNELYYYAGCVTNNILLMLKSCFSFYITSGNKIHCHYPIYKMKIDFDYTRWNIAETDKINCFKHTLNTDLLSMCKLNMHCVTLDLWLFWAECDEVSGKTLQKEIAENMFVVMELVKELSQQDVEHSLASEVVLIFSTMASNCQNEVYEINEDTVDTLLSNVSNNKENQKKWFKALLSVEDLFSSEKYFSCLETNVHLVDEEDVLQIFDLVIDKLSKSSETEHHKRLKQFALNAAETLNFDGQLNVSKLFFKKYGINCFLIHESFTQCCTQLFNKAVNIEECEQEKFLSACIILSLQDPKAFIMKVLCEVMININQLPISKKILKVLNHISVLKEHEEILIFPVLNEIMDSKLKNITEQENFHIAIVEFINEGVLNGKMYIEFCLFKNIHNSCLKQDWSMLSVWLNNLYAFCDGSIFEEIYFDRGASIVVLAQILEINKWDYCSFTLEAVNVRNISLKIIDILLPKYMKESNITGTNYSYVQHKLKGFLSPINVAHFAKLWLDESSNDSTFLLLRSNYSIETINGIIHEIKENPNKERGFLVSAIIKMLPSLTLSEWKVLTHELQNMIHSVNDKSQKLYLLFNILVDALILISKNENEKTESKYTTHCLDYCVRNLSSLLKEDILPVLKRLPPPLPLRSFQKMLYLFEHLPEAKHTPTSSLIINIYVEIMTTLMEQYSNLNNDEYYESRNYFKASIRLIKYKKLREALLRKLTDVMSK